MADDLSEFRIKGNARQRSRSPSRDSNRSGRPPHWGEDERFDDHRRDRSVYRERDASFDRRGGFGQVRDPLKMHIELNS